MLVVSKTMTFLVIELCPISTGSSRSQPEVNTPTLRAWWKCVGKVPKNMVTVCLVYSTNPSVGEATRFVAEVKIPQA